MQSSSSSVSFNCSLRLALLCLLATGVLLRPTPPSVHSASPPQTQQNLVPEVSPSPLNSAREGHTATLLQNGKVLVAGGRDGSAPTKTAELYDSVTTMWTTANTLGSERHGHSAVLLRNGQVLVLGGQGLNNSFLDTAEIYDPTSNTWQTLTNRMNAPRFHATATLLADGRVLVAGGQSSSNSYLRSAEIYDPDTRTWRRLDPGNNPLGNMTDMRAEHTATLLTDGRVLVAGGSNGTAALKTAEVFEPNTNRWRRVGDLITARRQHTATLLPDNTVLVTGGSNASTALNNSETYNTATSAWTASGNLAQGRLAHTATLLPNGRVLVVGGRNAAGTPLNSAEVYYYISKSWSSAPSFPNVQPFTLVEARSNHTATVLPSGQVLIAGGLGSGNAALSSAELYEYATGSWSATTQMANARAGHTATLLPNGKVLVVGGLRSNSPRIAFNGVELYDPTTGNWSATGSLNTARYNHTATLLPSGKVLVVGGQGDSGTAELYDPVTGNWANTPAPGVARFFHTATLLPNGLVLVAGGVGSNGARTNSVQLYDPNGGVNGSWSTGPGLSQARSDHTATLLPDGTVLVFGGLATNNAPLNTGALFTPSGNSGSWAALNFSNTSTSMIPTGRYAHAATLLPTNRVLMSGGLGVTVTGNVSVLGNSQVYDIKTRSFVIGQASTASRSDHTATLLPNGRVLLFGGRTINAGSGCGEPGSAPQAQIFDPFVPIGTSVLPVNNPLQARSAHTATLLPNGQVLIAGGLATEQLPNCTDDLIRHAELYDSGLGFQESWRPVISFLSGGANASSASGALVAPEQANLITVNGTNLQGISEASGHGAQSAATNYPVAQVLSLSNEQLAFIPVASASGWSNNDFSFTPLAGFAPGPALLTVYANGIPSVAHFINSNGDDFAYPNAVPMGTISGRVVLHNGVGLVANVMLAPEPGSPVGCSAARTITTAPNGEFAFRDLVVSPSPTPSPTPTGNVTGVVRRADTQQPLAGATVAIANTNLSTTSASNGTYTLNSVPSGAQTLTAMALGFSATQVEISVPTNQTLTRDLSLQPVSTTGDVLGVVYNATNNQTIPGALVSLANVTKTSNSNGAYVFNNVPEGQQTITAQANGFLPTQLQRTVVAGQTIQVNIPLFPTTGTITGTVSYSFNGAIPPLAGATVRVASTGQQTTTDSKGAYRLDNVPVGSQSLTASATGYSQQSQTSNVGGGQTVNFTLLPNLVRGTVRAVSNATVNPPLSGATVSSSTGRSTTSLSDGTYTLFAVPAGTQTLTASRTGYQNSSQTIIIPTAGGSLTGRDFDLRPFQVFIAKPLHLTFDWTQFITPPPINDIPNKAQSQAVSKTEVVEQPAVPAQTQGVCRYRITPSATTTGNAAITFFPTSALFNMTETSLGSIGAGARIARLTSALPPPVEQNCINCVDNVFVSKAPEWTLSGQIQTPTGMLVPDVNLEFSVPYPIFDDKLTCKITTANPTGSCKTPGAETVTGDKCAVPSTNPFFGPAAEFFCACTTLNGNLCEKTVLDRVSPSGAFMVVNVPHGANAVLTPQDRAGGAHYNYSLPGLPTQDFIRIDQVTQNYANQNIIATAACATPNATITTASAQVCANSPGNTASVADAGAGATYNWTITNGTITGGQGTRTIIWTAGSAGTTMLNVTVATGASCSASGSAQVTVNPTPAANAGPDQTKCQGVGSTTTFTLNGAVSNGTPQWSVVTSAGLANITFANANNATTTVTATGSGSAVLRLNSSSATCGSAPDEVTVTVNPLPVVTIAPSSAQVCAGSTGNTASVPDAGVGASYNWMLGGGTITNGQGTRNITFTAGASGNITLNVSVTTGALCNASNSAAIPITALPTADAGADQTLCQSASGTTTFTVTGAVANGAPAWGVVNKTGTADATISTPNAATTNVNVTGNGTVTLRLTVTGAVSCGPAIDDVLLTVNALPDTPAITASAAVCANSTNNQASGPAGVSGYLWTITNGTITSGATAQTVTYTAGASGNVTLTLRVTNATTCTASNTRNISINTAPSLTTQPTSQTVCENSPVTFTAAANNASAVQWQVSTDGGANFTNVPGANSATLSFTASAAQNGALYRSVFSNDCGTVNTNAATLNVTPVPAITAQPSNQTACENSPVNFSAAANNSSSVQWQVSTDGGANFSNVPGANNPTLSFTANSAQNGARYRAVFTNSCGSLITNTATLTINPLLSINTQPASQVACAGAAVSFNVAASGTAPLSYQWRKNNAPINGAMANTFNLAAVTAADAGDYDVVVTSACGTLNSSKATLTVNATTAITTQPINQAACLGGAATFSVAATGANLSYQWRKSNAPINGATGSSYTINAATAADAAQYDVVVTGACGTAPSNAVTLTVNAFALTTANATFLATGGANAVDLTATVGQCTWNAISNDNWITITSVTSTSGTAPSSGTGNGRVNYSVATNTATTARTGTLTIAGLNFTVTQSGSALTPRLDTLSQASALAGSAGFTLTVTGANFTNTSVVRWQGSARATTFGSTTQLTAQITATDLATAGTFTVDVFDPPPGGGASNALSFTVIQPNPVPTLASLNPNSATAGGAAFALTVNGTNFVNGAVVRWNNTDRNTSFVSATQLTAAIPASDIATAGTATVTVFNSAPGGGTSTSLTFTINQAAPPAPTLTSLNPNSATAGGTQLTLTVTGTNFVNTSVVRWNSTGRTTTFVSATQLSATIPASDIAQPGTAQVTVFTPANSSGGGGESGTLSFTIQPAPPPPMFTSMSPNAAVVGGQGFTLTINGSGFSSGTVVRWNGSNRPTTFVSGTQVTATIPASDIAQPGINQVTIFTPPPGGGSATALTFVVGTQATNASAASFAQERSAAESITSVFGVELATTTVIATTIPLPTTLAGTTVKVRDSLGAERNAPLFFVSPGQINYLVPQGTATGTATAIITSGNNKISVAALDVQIVAPGLFTANATGQGVPSGVLLRISSTGQQSYEPLAQFQGGSFVPLPINLGPAGDQVFLVLFGTGMRGFTSLANASATLGNVNLPVLFIGVQPEFVGVDQVNLGPLSRSLAGRGNVNLVLTVEGRATNTVQLNIQ